MKIQHKKQGIVADGNFNGTEFRGSVVISENPYKGKLHAKVGDILIINTVRIDTRLNPVKTASWRVMEMSNLLNTFQKT